MDSLREQIAEILESNPHTQHTMETIRPCSFCYKQADKIIALLPTTKSYKEEYKPSTSKETVNINEWLEENKP